MIRIYYVTRGGLFLDKHGRFTDNMTRAWTTCDKMEAIRMCEEYMAFVGIV